MSHGGEEDVQGRKAIPDGGGGGGWEMSTKLCAGEKDFFFSFFRAGKPIKIDLTPFSISPMSYFHPEAMDG